jgi:hypothetical protein
MPQHHRVTLTARHYDLVRRFMVVQKLPTARAATERMIELAASNGRMGKGHGVLLDGGDKPDESTQRAESLAIP